MRATCMGNVQSCNVDVENGRTVRLVGFNQGNLKGIQFWRPSCMEVSYCTSEHFCSYARQTILLSVSCLSRVDLNHARILFIVQ